MTRIAIDPITRIEGHLRIEAEVQDGKVREAWSSGTMFRGLELILRGRDPREAWFFAQRACGVCTTVHALASVRAVEDALGVSVPENAKLVRNIIAGTQFIHDHVIHFFHLHALDWVDVVSATAADPAAASRLAQSLSAWPKSSTEYFQGVQDRLKAFVGSGQLGPFANGYWGHPAYRLSPEGNLVAVAHYLEALDWQRDIVRVHAILGGKNPHPQTYAVGGMTLRMATDSPTGLNGTTMNDIESMLANARTFVEKVLVPDVLYVAGQYADWFGIGRGIGNYMAYGDFATDVNDDSSVLFPRGRVMGRDLGKVEPVDQQEIAEAIVHSWYEYERDGNAAKHPWEGETRPKYGGPNPPFESLEGYAKYSWLKAPRYDGQAMEVGPLARMLVGYASGKREIRDAIDGALGNLGVAADRLFSTMGRIAARALECQVLLPALDGWARQLRSNLESGRLQVADSSKWNPESWPAQAQGFGWEEAPRGALGHWVVIENKAIKNYQLVVPSTWNGSPRDGDDRRGAWEEALLDTPLADADQPLEILRTVHSFDPCMACAVHVSDPEGGQSVEVRVL